MLAEQSNKMLASFIFASALLRWTILLKILKLW